MLKHEIASVSLQLRIVAEIVFPMSMNNLIRMSSGSFLKKEKKNKKTN